jgi:hypothetical protein
VARVEKYECFIEKFSMRNSKIGVCMCYWHFECVLIIYFWYNAVISISKF